MRSSAAMASALAVAIAAIAMATTAAAAVDGAQQVDGNFCADAPTALDSRIAAAVNALAVTAPTTPPIAILDTGVADGAPEIANRTLLPFDATTGGTDGSDVDGHGTEVAGIAAGAPGLVQGISPTSPIIPVRIFNRSDESTAQWLTAGINWASGHGAAAINISSATPLADATAADVAGLTRAITNAFNRGSIVIASAGNTGTTAAQLPAALPHVLTVGASDLTGTRSTFSNVGPWVDLVAPAASLVAPMPIAYCSSGYGVANGTSFAAPAVAGAAALLAQLRPELSPQQRFDVLRSSATDVAPQGRDDETGFGLLNVQAAVTARPPAPETSREVDDDPFYVRGVNAKGHPVRLTHSRKALISGQLSAAKDPADVYPVRLRKNERLTAHAVVRGSGALAALGLWKPTVGNFDVTNGVAKNEIVSTGGFGSDVALKMLAKKTGTYYLSVEAPDAIDPDDPTDVAPITEPYQLTLSKTAVKPAKKKKKTTRKKRK